MKIALTSLSPNLEVEIDPRFGRSTILLIGASETQEWQAHPNPGTTVRGGAGIRAAQLLSDQNVEAVLSGDFGPHAYTALEKAGIPMYLFGTCRTAREAIAGFQAGSLERIGGPTRGECHPEAEEIR